MSNAQPGRPASDEFHLGTEILGRTVGNPAVRRLFCVGMAGTGVKAIAEWFAAAGWQVTGSDLSATDEIVIKFQSRGIRLHREHSADHVFPKTDLLIYSPAVPESNPERQAASKFGIPQWSYPEALGHLMREHDGISIAGTHGKSTTTALVGHVLRQAGRSPSILCGAEMVDTSLNGVFGEWTAPHPGDMPCPRKNSDSLFVAESCEYRGHFLHLNPRIVGLLGIEPDHFDCFPTFEMAIDTYRRFIERIPPTGTLVANLDCPATCAIAHDVAARRVFVSLTDHRADYFVQRAESGVDGLRLLVRLPDRSSLEITSSLWGQHHAINVVTALALTSELGVPPESFSKAAATFAGIRRRFERRGDWDGRHWIDDYAHHPTAVRALIHAARDRFPSQNIWCVFQPHQISRTRELSSDFAQALAHADGALVLPVFGARETVGSEQIVLSRQLVERVNSAGTLAHFVHDLKHTWNTLQTHTRPGDVVLTVGAGNIDRIYHELTGRIRRHHAS